MGEWKDPPINVFCPVCGRAVNVIETDRVTCSKAHQDEFMRGAERYYGVEMVVRDDRTGLRYSVPTRYIIENGLDVSELWKFPVVG